jgi:hypothetical protein
MVAGEVDATDEVMNHVRGFPSEKKLAKKVLPLPEPVKGKTLIASDSEIAPCQQTDKVVKVSITHGRFKLLPTDDNFSLVDAAGEPFAGGAHIVEHRMAVADGTKLILKDKHDQPVRKYEFFNDGGYTRVFLGSLITHSWLVRLLLLLQLALAIEEISLHHKSFVIGSLSPLFDGDEVMGEVGDLKFYPMFKVRDIDDSHLDFRSLLVWNGKQFQPFLRIVPAQNLPDKPSRDTVPPKKGDNLVVDPQDLEKVYAIMTKKSTGVISHIAGWDLIVAPGADVGCMIILCAIVDDMVGWFA